MLFPALLPSENDFTPPNGLTRVGGGFADCFGEPAQAGDLRIGDRFARAQSSREFTQYRKTGRVMAPVHLCGAALPEKMHGDRAESERVDELGDVTCARRHGVWRMF